MNIYLYISKLMNGREVMQPTQTVGIYTILPYSLVLIQPKLLFNYIIWTCKKVQTILLPYFKSKFVFVQVKCWVVARRYPSTRIRLTGAVREKCCTNAYRSSNGCPSTRSANTAYPTSWQASRSGWQLYHRP